MAIYYLQFADEDAEFANALRARLVRDGVDCQIESGDKTGFVVPIVSPAFLRNPMSQIVLRGNSPGVIAKPCELPPEVKRTNLTDLSSPALLELNYPEFCRFLGGTPPPPDPAFVNNPVFQELLDTLRAASCVLVEGSALTALSNHPLDDKDFARTLVKWAMRQGIVEIGERLYAEIDAGFVDPVIDLIGEATRERHAELIEFLQARYPMSTEAPRIYQLLAGMPFTAAISQNLGDTLEVAFRQRLGNCRVFTPADTEALLSTLTNEKPFVLKLLGSLDRPDTVRISAARFTDEVIADNPAFVQFLESLFVSRSLVFIGFRLNAIEDLLRVARIRGNPTRKHFAIAPVGSTWETHASLLRRRYGIEVLDYPKDTPAMLVSILKNLDQQLGPAHIIRRKQTSPIKRVVLENIGPFESLDIPLNPSWNLFLGNNGVGKSSILRAIALALCGRDAEQYANRIMRVGATTSSVVIETESNTYRTLIQRTSSGIEVTSHPIRPLEPEGWLALAFPPLRTGTGSATEATERSATADILPLLRGEADSRLDNLRSWIANLDHRIARGQSQEANKKLLDTFFAIVSDLTEGITLRYGGFNPETRQVTVITDDGEVPLEFVSQGTASLISWIGVVLQRFYETFGADAEPTSRYGLVLMDEIDAHMHPRWQQILIDRLKKYFPNVQFLATTHSPLIVSNVDARNVSLVWRDESTRKIRLKNFEDLKLDGMDVERILTGPLFGLPDTRSAATQDKEREYQELLLLEAPNEQQVQRRKELAKQLLGSGPSPATINVEDIFDVVMPNFPPSLATKASIAWLRVVGDGVKAGDFIGRIFDGNNDNVMPLVAPVDGVIVEIFAVAHRRFPAGSVVAKIRR